MTETKIKERGEHSKGVKMRQTFFWSKSKMFLNKEYNKLNSDNINLKYNLSCYSMGRTEPEIGEEGPSVAELRFLLVTFCQ